MNQSWIQKEHPWIQNKRWSAVGPRNGSTGYFFRNSLIKKSFSVELSQNGQRVVTFYEGDSFDVEGSVSFPDLQIALSYAKRYYYPWL